MSAGTSEEQRSYVDRSVQTTPPLKSPSRSLSSPRSPFNDVSVSVIAASPPPDTDHPFSDAYTHVPSQSSPRPVALKVQRNIKPRLPSSKPSEITLGSNRIVSMPETAPVFSTKIELSQNLRVVSMPEKRPTGVYAADSSMSSDGVNTSLSTSSFASVSDATSGISLPHQHGQAFLHTPSPPSTPDSVLIIENNGELGDGFLHCESIVEEPELEEQAKADDAKGNGWIAWTRSPPRPIPALHGPLSLPYARCPSGAEGTIIEEQDNLPRMIWGLGTDQQQASPVPTVVQDMQHRDHHVNVGPMSNARQSPVHHDYTQEESVPPVKPQKASAPAPPPAHSPASARAGQRDHRYSENHPPEYFDRRDIPHAGYSAEDAIVLEHLLGRHQEAKPHVNDYAGHHLDILPRTVEERLPLHDLGEDLQSNRQFGYRYDRYSALAPANFDRSRDSAFRSSMRVSSRPAPGSALPQIFIEPRSPEVPSSRRFSALELVQQYQQRLVSQPSVLPTPPNSSSPIWSSNFSPYQESLLSPFSNTYLGGQSPVVSQGLHHSSLDPSEQLRRLVHERLTDMGSNFNAASSLAPAAQISPALRTSQQLTDFNELSSPQAILNYLAKRDSHLSPSAIDLLCPSQHRNTSSISVPPVKPRERLSSSASYGYVPPSPTSPESYRPKSYGHHQPRSIPLARLIQRRLSAVPEEDASSTVRGRSPSPSLPSVDERADPRHRRHAGGSSAVLRDSSYRRASQYVGDGRNLSQVQVQVRDDAAGHLYREDDIGAKVRLPVSPMQTRYDTDGQNGRGRGEYGQRGRDGHDQERCGAQEVAKEGLGRGNGGRRKPRGGRSRKPYNAAATSMKG